MGKGYLAALALIVSLLVASAVGAQPAFANICDASTIATSATNEEKIRIVLSGLPGEHSMVELCRREAVAGVDGERAWLRLAWPKAA